MNYVVVVVVDDFLAGKFFFFATFSPIGAMTGFSPVGLFLLDQRVFNKSQIVRTVFESSKAI